MLARHCMAAIDRDRTLLAAEAGYTAAFTTMDAVTSAVANKKTVGEDDGTAAGGRQKELPQRTGSGGQNGGHGSGLKNQVLVGWRSPPRNEIIT
eukprot:COSAG02_NODE_1222_length_13800_cov_66.755565_3_plen_94_part_00